MTDLDWKMLEKTYDDLIRMEKIKDIKVLERQILVAIDSVGYATDRVKNSTDPVRFVLLQKLGRTHDSLRKFLIRTRQEMILRGYGTVYKFDDGTRRVDL